MDILRSHSDRNCPTLAVRQAIGKYALFAIGLLQVLNSSCSRTKPIEFSVAESKQTVEDVEVPGLRQRTPAATENALEAKEQLATNDQSKKRATTLEELGGSIGDQFGADSSGDTPSRSNDQDKAKAIVVYADALKAQYVAQVAAAKGELDSAYTKTLLAWQSVREFPEDDACQDLATELFRELKVYGDRLSAATVNRKDGSVVRKPIRFE